MFLWLLLQRCNRWINGGKYYRKRLPKRCIQTYNRKSIFELLLPKMTSGRPSPTKRPHVMYARRLLTGLRTSATRRCSVNTAFSNVRRLENLHWLSNAFKNDVNAPDQTCNHSHRTVALHRPFFGTPQTQLPDRKPLNRCPQPWPAHPGPAETASAGLRRQGDRLEGLSHLRA